MPHFFERRDLFGNSPAVWILAAVLFAIPFGSWSLSQLERRDDAGLWLPPSDSVRQAHEWAAETFPLQQDLLVTWTGSSLNDPRLKEFRKCLEPTRDEQGVLRGGQPQIASVSDPRKSLQQMFDGEVSPSEAVQRLTGYGLGRGPLCVRLSDAGRKRLRRLQGELPIAAKKRWGVDLQVKSANESSAIASESSTPLITETVILSTDGVLRDNANATHDLSISVSGVLDNALYDWLMHYQLEGTTAGPTLIEDLFYIPGSPVTIGITFSDAGRVDRAESLKLVRTAAMEVGVLPADLKIIGPAVVERDLRDVTTLASWNSNARWQDVPRRSALLTSIFAGLVLTVLILRDVRLILICATVTVGAVLSSLALMPVAGADLSVWQFLTPFWIGACTLTGAAQLARQWQVSRADHPTMAVAETVRQTWSGGFATGGMLLIAALVWCLSPLGPVRDWGETAAIAIIAVVSLVQLGVPSLLLLWGGRTTALPHDPALWYGMASLWSLRPAWQALGTFAVFAAAAYGLRFADCHFDFLHGLPTTSTARMAASDIETALAGTTLSETMIRFDARAQDEHDAIARLELIREVESQLRIHPAVSGCQSWADFHPTHAPLPPDASRLELTRRNRQAQSLLDEWRNAEPTSLVATYYAIAKQGRDALLDGDREYCRAGDELWRISTRVRCNGATDPAQTQRELDGLIRGVLKAAPGTKHHLLGSLALQVQTEQLALRWGLIALGMTAALTALLTLVVLRHFAAAFVILLPTVVPIAAVLGCWSWMGGTIDVTAMLAAGVAMGIAAGQLLPMLSAFHRERSGGQSRDMAVKTMLAETGPQACRTAWIIGCVLLPLSTSDAGIVGHLGSLLPMMIAAGAVSQVMWLPQLLTGPLGLCFAQGPTIERQPHASLADTGDAMNRAA